MLENVGKLKMMCAGKMRVASEGIATEGRARQLEITVAEGPIVRIAFPPALSLLRTRLVTRLPAVAGPMWRPRNAGVRGGTMSSNLLCSSSQSVSAVNAEAVAEKPRTLAAFWVWLGT